MNIEQATVAIHNKAPVVDTVSGDLGVIEQVREDGRCLVLRLGHRLTEPVLVDNLEEAAWHVLAESKQYVPTDDDKQDTP